MKITAAALVSNCFTPSSPFRKRKRPEARLLTWVCSSFSWWWSCPEQVLTYVWITVNGLLWSCAPHSFTYWPPAFTEQEIPLNVRAALTTCWGRMAVLLLSLSLPPSIRQPVLCPALALCAAFQQTQATHHRLRWFLFGFFSLWASESCNRCLLFHPQFSYMSLLWLCFLIRDVRAPASQSCQKEKLGNL